MISIFNGRKRSLGGESSEIYAQVGVKFRDYLHYLKGAKLHVFLAICLHANENGWAWPSVKLLEKETGYSGGTINDALNELCEIEINEERLLLRFQPKSKEDGKFHSNHYLIFPSPEEVEEYRNKGIPHTAHNLPLRENPVTVKPPDKEEPPFKEEQTIHADTVFSDGEEPELEGDELLDAFGLGDGYKAKYGDQPKKPKSGHWSTHAAEPWRGFLVDQIHARDGCKAITLQRVAWIVGQVTGMTWESESTLRRWLPEFAAMYKESRGDWSLIERAAHNKWDNQRFRTNDPRKYTAEVQKLAGGDGDDNILVLDSSEQVVVLRM